MATRPRMPVTKKKILQSQSSSIFTLYRHYYTDFGECALSRANSGDVPYDAAWGGTPKAHTKDPTPVSAENNSLGKKGAIASGESFEEYMRKRAAQGK